MNVISARKRPGDPWGGVIVALAVAVVILGVLIYFLPRTPKMTRPSSAAEVPPQATGAMLQIQNLRMSLDPTGKSLTLMGRINNNGTQTVNGALMHIQFLGAQGANAGSVDLPVESVSVEGKPSKADIKGTQSLAEAPLKPNDTREFQVEVPNVPAGWNHQMPGISFTQITSHP